MQRLLIIVLIVLVFAAFMITYTVRFTEKAVITTFGRADTGSVITTPGLRFKIPYIQQVTKYDSRARYLETNQETHQTADESPILVTAYMTWAVEDPLKFFRSFSASGDSPRDHYREAEKILKTKLRSALGEVSRYRFGELFAADDKGSKLGELEHKVLENLEQTADKEAALADFGVRAVSVGITRMGLPADATRAVFQRMNAERGKIANKAVEQGKAQAIALRAGADADAQKINAFANRLARGIRGRGDVEASQWFKKLADDPKLAVFIQNMEFIKALNGGRTTLVLPTSLPGMELLRPDALKNLKAGDIPVPNFGPAVAAETRPDPAKAATPVAGAERGAK